MNQKIEWYKEVLSLEPGSKVFFPLARMQAEEGLEKDAVATLRHGLARNAEHIEARLLLIELLLAEGNTEALWAELELVTIMLGGYPGFWSAWEKRLSQNPSSRDAALALTFFSAWLRNETLSWSDVIEHGLRGILSGSNLPSPAKPATPHALDELQEFMGKTLNEQSVPDASDEADSFPPVKAVSDILPENIIDEPAAYEGLDEGDDDTFSLKTKSMAEVLADQGDYQGALDIYEELLQHCASDTEREYLQMSVERIKGRSGMASGSDDTSVPAESGNGDDEAFAEQAQGKNRILDVLEALALRLEAKS